MNAPNIRSILERTSKTVDSVTANSRIHDEIEYRPFAGGRVGNQPQLTLVLRMKNGFARAFSYSYFYSIESQNPSDGFVIDFGQAKVTIAGRHLEQLFDYVCQHKATEIVEAPRNQMLELPPSDPVVHRITVS